MLTVAGKQPGREAVYQDAGSRRPCNQRTADFGRMGELLQALNNNHHNYS